MATKKTTQSSAMLKKRIAELELENKRLRSKSRQKKSLPSFFWLRTVSSGLLIVLASIMLVNSIMFLWLQRTVLDTDTWVEKTSEVIAVDSVQADVSNRITAELFNQVDLEQYVEEVLPPRAAPLAVPISAGIEDFVNDKTKEILASDKFAQVWAEANRLSHQSLINSIERLNTVNSENSPSDVIYISGESLLLNLRPILDEVKADLVDRGLTFLPQDQVISQDRLTFEVVQINNLPAILGFYNMLNRLSFWLPIMAVIFGVGAIYVANNRRRAFTGIIVVSIVLAVISVQVARAGQYSVSQQVAVSSQTLSSQSATAIYQIITNDLITGLRWLMGVLFLIGAFIFLSGPSSAAKWIRSKVGSLFKNYKENNFIKTVAKNAHSVVAGIGLVVATLVVLAPISSPPIAMWIIVVGGLLSVAVLAIRQELSG